MQQEMQYIYEIYRAGSFSQAAKNLYAAEMPYNRGAGGFWLSR